MPFQSNAQRKFLFAKHPEIAKRWAKEYPHQGKLPEHKRHWSKGRKKHPH
jgi:hypothetical protein